MRRTASWFCAPLIAIGLWSSGAVAGHFVSLEKPEAYELMSVGFALDRETDVTVNAVGLAAPRGRRGWSWSLSQSSAEPALPLAVYAWLIDARSRRPVWVMRQEESAQTGSLDELRESRATVALPPGRYELYLFAGLESFLENAEAEPDEDSWWWERLSSLKNRPRPDLRAALEDCFVRLSADGISYASVISSEVDAGLEDALIRHTRLADSEFVRMPFRLNRISTLRIYSLIEKSTRGGQAADFGWIVEAGSRRVVWDGSTARSGPAGGDPKNRLIDEQLSFEAGEYVLYHGTDDSHSWGRFNGAPPHDPQNWGTALLPGEGYRAGDLERIDLPEPAALIDLTGAGDEAYLEQRFRLTRDSEIWIQSGGEFVGRGSVGVFSDLARIIDPDGDVVWEMSQGNSRAGGGADKNRLFDGLVRIPAGDYRVYVVTDGTHSADSWNAAAPFEPSLWGVRLRPGPDSSPSDLVLLDPASFDSDPAALARIDRVGNSERRSGSFNLSRAVTVRIYAVGEGDGDSMHDYGYLVEERTGDRIWEMRPGNTTAAGGAEKNRRALEEIELQPGRYTVFYESDDSHAFGSWNSTPPADPTGWGVTLRRAN